MLLTVTLALYCRPLVRRSPWQVTLALIARIIFHGCENPLVRELLVVFCVGISIATGRTILHSSDGDEVQLCQWTRVAEPMI